MKVALVVVWTVVGAVAGMFAFGELGPLFGFPDMEGQSAIFAVFVGVPVGGLAGLVGAIAFVRAYASDRRRLGYGLAIPLAVAVVLPVSGFLLETWRTYDQIDEWGDAFDLGFQVRLPEGAASPAGAALGIKLVSSKESPECDVYAAPYGLTEEAGRFIVSGQCEIFYAVAERTLVVRIGDEPSYVYDVRVAARPQSATYSDWIPVDAVVDNGPGADGARRPPRPGEMTEIRYAAR